MQPNKVVYISYIQVYIKIIFRLDLFKVKKDKTIVET